MEQADRDTNPEAYLFYETRFKEEVARLIGKGPRSSLQRAAAKWVEGGPLDKDLANAAILEFEAPVRRRWKDRAVAASIVACAHAELISPERALQGLTPIVAVAGERVGFRGSFRAWWREFSWLAPPVGMLLALG